MSANKLALTPRNLYDKAAESGVDAPPPGLSSHERERFAMPLKKPNPARPVSQPVSSHGRCSPSPEVVRELLSYCPKSGLLHWKWRDIRWFSDSPKWGATSNQKRWNGRYAGQEAITANSNGYKIGYIFGRIYLAHRLAWVVHHGFWPPEFIDHINGDASDNRIVNLRLATRQQNTQNRSSKRGGTSRFLGVCRVLGSKKKWQATIRVNGRTLNLGHFHQEEDAAEAYKRAALLHHGEFASRVLK